MSCLESKSLAALISCEGIGHQTISHIFRLISEKHSSWEEFWVGGRKVWQDFELSEKQIEGIEKFQKEYSIDSYFEWLQQRNIRVITKDSSEYPPLLQEIENTPLILFAKGGQMEWAGGIPIAVVGTRHMTSYGKQATEKITEELVWGGAHIISGFMYGVDSCAHRAALEADGKTVGVLGFGFEHMYPKSHFQFYEECLDKGMSFISPFAPKIQAHRGNFPARNAIVAAMSAAVVVTEAAEYAAEFGRTVCAVPGSIFSPYSSGTKWLVNQGAVLVNSGEEVLSAIGKYEFSHEFKLDNDKGSLHLDNTQRKIIEFLQFNGSSSLNTLSKELNASAEELLSLLTLLELQQKIRKEHNGNFTL